MIVKDEAANLGRCLDSVRALVDEVVVLDTGSSDGTPERAAALGARVLHASWPGDFAAARNVSLRACAGDWILVLDADEAIDPLDHPVIRRAVARADVDAWALEIRNHLPGGAFTGPTGAPRRNDGRYPLAAGLSHYWSQRTVRLFRAQPGDVYAGRVHEQAEPYFLSRGLALCPLEAVIHHFGKLDPVRDRAKQGCYLELARAEAEAFPGDAGARYNLLQEALMVGEWETALDSARACLALASGELALAVLGAATALRRLGRPGEALVQLDASPRAGEPVVQNARGECLAALGRAEEAQEAFLAAVDADPGYTLPVLNLVKLLEGQGRAADARRLLEAALIPNPLDLNLWTALVSLSSRAGELGLAAREAWEALRAVPGGGQGLWHQLVAHTLLATGHAEDARRVLRQGLEAFPGHPDLVRLLGTVPAAPTGSAR